MSLPFVNGDEHCCMTIGHRMICACLQDNSSCAIPDSHWQLLYVVFITHQVIHRWSPGGLVLGRGRSQMVDATLRVPVVEACLCCI